MIPRQKKILYIFSPDPSSGPFKVNAGATLGATMVIFFLEFLRVSFIHITMTKTQNTESVCSAWHDHSVFVYGIQMDYFILDSPVERHLCSAFKINSLQLAFYQSIGCVLFAVSVATKYPVPSPRYRDWKRLAQWL